VRASSIALALCLLSISAATEAQPAATEAQPAAAEAQPAAAEAQPAAADTLFREGVALGKAGQYAQAIEKFRASYELDPARGTLLGLAMSEERAGRLADALGHYAALRDLANQAGDRPRVEVAERAMAELEPRVPRLTVLVKGDLPPTVDIKLNGRQLPRGALGTPLPVNPGTTELAATAPDHQPFQFRAVLGEGERTTVEMELGAPRASPAAAGTAAEPRAASSHGGWTAGQVGSLVLGAAGLVLLGAGTYLWVSSGDKYDHLVVVCPNNSCPASARSEIDAGRNQETLARVCWITGGLALAAGATWFFLVRPGRKATPAAALGAGPSTLRWEGRF
jgi:tetratricopeptide (TPR) repeat protein